MGVARSVDARPGEGTRRARRGVRDMSGGSPPDESPPAGADALHDALELARATLSDADAALEAATHALSPGASDEDSDSYASEPATDGPDDEATDSGSVSLSVDEDGVWVGVLAGDGDFDDASDYDSESYTDDSDDHLDDFDDDAMHFEIEGEIPLGAAGDDPNAGTPVDDEERGVYMLPDGEPIPSVTGMNHAQGSDSVGASSREDSSSPDLATCASWTRPRRPRAARPREVRTAAVSGVLRHVRPGREARRGVRGCRTRG